MTKCGNVQGSLCKALYTDGIFLSSYAFLNADRVVGGDHLYSPSLLLKKSLLDLLPLLQFPRSPTDGANTRLVGNLVSHTVTLSRTDKQLKTRTDCTRP